MIFDHSFFENEIRSGYYVPTLMKRCWAAELQIVGEIDRVCKKYGIRYFAAYGTLLGAVRHKGFIPWDDDIDLYMLRDDYVRFFSVAEEELKPWYGVKNRSINPYFEQGMGAVSSVNSDSYDLASIEVNYSFPFPISVDIFPLDSIPDDEEEQGTFRRLLIMLNTLWYYCDTLSDSELDEMIVNLYNNFRIRINRQGNLKEQFARIIDAVEAMYNDADTEYLAFVTYWNRERPCEKIPKRAFEGVDYLDFENIKIPVPIGYKDVLASLYGDYMVCSRSKGGHDYPTFMKYRTKISREMDESLFYRFDYGEYTRLLTAKEENFQNKPKQEKESVIFLASKYETWLPLKEYYEALKKDDKKDVKVVIVPFYETDGMEKWGVHKFGEPILDERMLSENVDTLKYTECDFSELLPDTIITAMPYDKWNDAIMIPSAFMCLNIRKYCKELVYVQHFVMDDFDEDDGFANSMVLFHACVPGVMLSDAVIVQSEQMEQAYIRKIREVYGDEVAESMTDKIFEKDSIIFA